MPSKEPSRTKLRNARIAAESAALRRIPQEVLDQIATDGPMSGQQINATTMALKKAVERRSCAGGAGAGAGVGVGSFMAQ